MRTLPWTLLAAFSLAAPAQAKPCDGQAGPLRALASRLAKTTDRAALNAVVVEAVGLTKTVEGDEAQSCAHYLAAGAHFYLSNQRVGAQLHAAHAVAHLLRSQTLTPKAMESTQGQARLKTAWQRVGLVPGWLEAKNAPVWVEIPAAAQPITLSPADMGGWEAACGTSRECAEVVRYALTPAQPLRLQLRPGQYRVSRAGRCGASEHVARVIGGALALPAPKRCQITLKVMGKAAPVQSFSVEDAEGRPLALDALHGGLGVVTIRAKGYLPEAVTLKGQEGELSVRLKRCLVDQPVRIQPQDAEVQGGGPGPWGPRQIAATRAGYLPLKTTIKIPPPVNCAQPLRPVVLVMDRQISVQGREPSGALVFPSQLWIEGEALNPASFGRPVGEYSYRALHPRFAPATGRLKVEPCRLTPCGAQRLEIAFTPRASKGEGAQGSGPYAIMGVGGALVLGGLIAGGAAMSTQSDIDDYTNKREEKVGLEQLIERRDGQIRAANLLSAAGAASLFLGYSWHLWRAL
ncbi:hypothetical protein KKF91_16780 [Myxococcota bacterium]|nr:hypothetical protein [Myxococcota bacterium]